MPEKASTSTGNLSEVTKDSSDDNGHLDHSDARIWLPDEDYGIVQMLAVKQEQEKKQHKEAEEKRRKEEEAGKNMKQKPGKGGFGASSS